MVYSHYNILYYFGQFSTKDCDMALYVVTGGAGFIGSHLTETLLSLGHQVTILDNLSTGKHENLTEHSRLITGDIRDQALLTSLLQEADGCFHLAAVASVQQSIENWRDTHSINLSATVGLFDAIATLKKPIPVVFASSAAIYGDNPNVPLAETETPAPLNAYGADKLGCELHGRVAANIYQIPNIGCRFFNIYGPRQDPNSPYSGVISIFSDHIKHRKKIVIFGDGKQSRDFVYVSDVVGGVIRAMDALHQGKILHDVVNICRGKSITINELASTIESIAGYEVEKHYEPARNGEIYTSLGNPQKLKQLLDYEAVTSLREGLISTINLSDEVKCLHG